MFLSGVTGWDSEGQKPPTVMLRGTRSPEAADTIEVSTRRSKYRKHRENRSLMT